MNISLSESDILSFIDKWLMDALNYEDPMKARINDSTKATRFALQNVASVAGLLMTTEAMVVENLFGCL